MQSRVRLAPTRLLLLSVGILFAGGCLDDGSSHPQVRFDQGTPVLRDGGPSDQGLPPPVLELGNIPNVTCGEKVGVIGRATPGVSIVVQGGASASGVIGTALPSDGRFCVPVTLTKGQLNHLQVMAHDQALGFSKPAMVAVQQQACSGNGEFEDAGVGDAGISKNVALGAPAKSKETPKKGNHGFVTDGKTSTWTMWKGGDWYCPFCDYDGWVMVSLDQLYEVERIVIEWEDMVEGIATYGKKFQVLYSALAEPPDPNLNDGYWTVAKAFTEGAGGSDPVPLKAQGSPFVRHVAVWFQQDGHNGNYDESFAVAEIEVYNKPKSSGPPPTPPTVCQGF